MGILKTGLKAVVAVKTADVIHQRVLDRQAEHAAAQGQAVPAQAATAAPTPAAAPPPAPAPPVAAAAPDMADRLQQLQQLGQLRDSGVLTDAEFEEQKARILAQ